jgi:cytochrome c biogenesis protein CcmG, thiol:disulfide interchange protein DsbE
MKICFSILTSFCIFFSIAFGQTNYIMTPTGKIIDTSTYAKIKAEHIEDLKTMLQSKSILVKIKDNLKEVRRSKDSIISSYNWEIKIGESKVNNSNSFDSENFIDKEFPLPLLTTLDNQKISITSLKGKPTLINFWFTNCKPCIEEMPVLNSIKSKFKDSVAITFETAEKAKSFLKKNKFDFIQVANAKKFTNSLKMHAFPMNIFLDKQGIVRKINNGIPYILDNKNKMKMGDGKEFLSALRELL